jgi:hypothetical protein
MWFFSILPSSVLQTRVWVSQIHFCKSLTANSCTLILSAADADEREQKLWL